MDYTTALAGMMDARRKLQTREAVVSLPEMSEQMQRLAAYTSAVEEHLATLEYSEELSESVHYNGLKSEGQSPTAAEREAKYATAEQKAEVKRLIRLVNSSWKLIDVTRSRFNHLDKEAKGQI